MTFIISILPSDWKLPDITALIIALTAAWVAIRGNKNAAVAKKIGDMNTQEIAGHREITSKELNAIRSDMTKVQQDQPAAIESANQAMDRNTDAINRQTAASMPGAIKLPPETPPKGSK